MRRTCMTGRSTERGSLYPSLTETQRIPTTGDWYGLLPPLLGKNVNTIFQGRKIYILFAGIVAVINSTLGSSLPSNAINYIAPYFNVTNEQQLVLPISLFLVGYVLGPLIFGPLSETYGRRIIMLSSFVLFTLFTMACALAPNWPSFLIFRLCCGINASSPITVVGGLYADVFENPVIRGRAMAIFMVVSRQRRPAGPLD